MSKTAEDMAEEYAWKHYGYSAINHQLDFLAGYQAAKPQWISVKDRLPEEGMEVVIGWFQQTASNKLYWTTDVAILTNKVFGGWRVYSEVTHWMPLPVAPKWMPLPAPPKEDR